MTLASLRRPRRRSEHVKKPLAEKLLFGELVDGGHVKVSVEDGKLAFDIDTSEVVRKTDPDDDEGERKVSEPVDS